MSFDKVLKFLGIAWSIVALIATAAFFFGGQWTAWETIRDAQRKNNVINPDMSQYVRHDELSTYVKRTEFNGYLRNGDEVYLKSQSKYIVNYDHRNKDELDLIMGGKSTPFVLEKK
ncbi:hypothetical protein FE848_15610 [Marinobacter sp. 1-3A]|uniref:hypothetical protein n=1 Tax=Marinobacter sp. 1-3A TaxID=2582920 RepID=UPI001907EF10|nr:hypothetical protein [Marinobacter sp. 1-3A]MBK1874651.1 hypothetical protein [Marinobacter sp. 1-3A]